VNLSSSHPRWLHLILARLNPALMARFALLLLMALALSLPYAIPPLLDWILGRDPALNIGLERAVDNMAFHLATAGAIALAWALALLCWFPPSRIPRNGLVGFVLLSGLAVLISSVVHSGWEFNPRTLLLPTCFGLVFLTTILACPSGRQIRGVLLLLPLIAVPVCLYALAQSQGYEVLNYSRVNPGTGEDLTAKQMVASTFGHPNYLASYLVPIFPFAVCMGLAPGPRIRRAVGLVCVTALAIGMLVGGTRGAWLATLTAIGPFYLITTFSPRFRRPLLFTGGLVAVIVFLVLVIPNPWLRVQFDVLDRLLASKEIVARFYYWTIAQHLWQDHPWLGIGYGNYNVLFWPAVAEFQTLPGSEYYQFVLAENVRGTPPQYVHNDHLQVLVEGGLLGAGLWLALWSVLMTQLWETGRLVRERPSDLLVVAAFAASFAAFATDGMTNFPVQIPASGMMFYLLLGLWVVWRGHQTGSWVSLTRARPSPRPADGLVPELPRVRPTQIRL
jgi:hypothetical protein